MTEEAFMSDNPPDPSGSSEDISPIKKQCRETVLKRGFGTSLDPQTWLQELFNFCLWKTFDNHLTLSNSVTSETMEIKDNQMDVTYTKDKASQDLSSSDIP